MTNNSESSHLSTALSYLQGKIVVLKLGGEVCSGSNLSDLAYQIAILNRCAVQLVLVHGGGPQIDDVLSELEIPIARAHGRRITDDDTLRVTKMVLKGLLGTDLVAALNSFGLRAFSLSGLDAQFILATKRPPFEVATAAGQIETIDYLNVGEIQRIDTSIISRFIEQNIVPVVCPLAGDSAGAVFNINADTIAAALAGALSATALVLLTNVDGVLENKEDPQSIISALSTTSLSQLIQDGGVSGGMLPKTQAAIKALAAGTKYVFITSGNKPFSLLNTLAGVAGCGTKLSPSKEKLTGRKVISEKI